MSIATMPKMITSRLSKSIQTMDVSRSPKDSPPTIKKKLCRLVSGALNGDNNDNNNNNTSSRRPKSSPIAIRRSNSILKKVSARGSPDSTGSSPSPSSNRRVQFSQKVTVFLMTDEGDVVCTDCQKLRSASENQRPVPRSLKVPDTSSRLEKPELEDFEDSSEINFRFVEDPDKGTMLKFIVPLGNDFKPDDIVVKANVSGSRIRLVANRPVSYPDGSIRMEQVNERFMLPIDVDPYMVTARLDVKGQLTVEAPVLTLAKRDNNKRTTVALSDISNKAQSKV